MRSNASLWFLNGMQAGSFKGGSIITTQVDFLRYFTQFSSVCVIVKSVWEYINRSQQSFVRKKASKMLLFNDL